MTTEPYISLHIEGGGAQKACSPYQELAAAIVERAVKDYKHILQKVQQSDLDLQTKRGLILEKNRIEAFFYSDWLAMLTDLDAETLMSACRRSAFRRSCSQKNIKKA